MDEHAEYNPKRDNPLIQVPLLPVVALDELKISFADAVHMCKERAGPILVKGKEDKLVVMPMEFYSKHFAHIKEHG